MPRWWVGWWLWHAGCISQDTYLLYVITCVSCITCSTCVLRVARVLRVKRVKRVLLVLLVLVVMLVSILSLLLQVLNTWFIENLKRWITDLSCDKLKPGDFNASNNVKCTDIGTVGSSFILRILCKKILCFLERKNCTTGKIFTNLLMTTNLTSAWSQLFHSLF